MPPLPSAPLRVAYFGRSNEYLSVQGLEITLANADVRVVSITAGRGDETYQLDGELQRIARREGIALHNLSGVRREVGELDLVISFSNPVVFPSDFIESVRWGVVNLHPAPLPRYRGCHAIEHAILEGADWFGATLHFCSAEIDVGEIIDEQSVPIGPDDNARAVWTKVDTASLALLQRNLERIVDAARQGRRVPSRPQQELEAHYYDDDSLPEQASLDLSMPWEILVRWIRAYDHPRRKAAYLAVGANRVRLTYRDGLAVVASIEQSADGSDVSSAPQSGARLDHVRIDVVDIEAARRFYEAALGLSVIVRYDTPTHTIVQMGANGRPPGVELWQEDGVHVNPSRTEHLAFEVSDVPAAVERIRALPYPIQHEPFTIEHETIAFVQDPDGHLIELNDFRGRPERNGPGSILATSAQSPARPASR